MKSTKQQLLDMGINAFGLDLFIESYNKATNTLINNNEDFPKDNLTLEFDMEVFDRGDRNGSVKIKVERIFPQEMIEQEKDLINPSI